MVLMADRLDMEQGFYRDEVHDIAVYTALAENESRPELRRLLQKLADTEKKHAKIWKDIISDAGETPHEPAFVGFAVAYYVFIRKVLGTAFAIKLLERGEERAIEEYSAALGSRRISGKGKAAIRNVILNDEKFHEKELSGKIGEYTGDLNYIKSIIFGLNDGLVELLAVVTGLAVVATSSLVVAVAGIVVGIAGTLSMAAGEYISSKSRGLVREAMREDVVHKTSPAKEAMYIGLFYFIGAIIAVLPFILGLVRYAGIITSIVLVVIVLTVVSTIVAIISDTSAKRRVAEMLVISLGAAFVTIILGAIIRYYFGISI